MSVFNYQQSGQTKWMFRFKVTWEPKRRSRKGFRTKAQAETAEKLERELAELTKHTGLIQKLKAQGIDVMTATSRRLADHMTPLPQLFAAFTHAPRGPSDREKVIATTKRILETNGHNWRTATTGVFDRRLAIDWFNHWAQATENLDQTASRSKHVSANSNFARFLSLFSDHALEHYDQHNLRLPDLAPLRKAHKANRFHIPRKDYRPPTEETLAAIIHDWQQLDDRNLFLAFGWAITFGLRKANIAGAHWDWIRTRENHVILDTTTDVKNQTGALVVKALDPYWTTMQTIASRNCWDQGAVLQGNHTERTDKVFRRLSQFLQDHGWEMDKKAHALRDFAGSCVAAKWGIYEACLFLNHADAATTQKHYSSFVKIWAFRDKAELPWSWAKHSTAGPALKIFTGTDQ